MGFYIHIQGTPNPNAVKFISQYTVKSEGKSNYKSAAEASTNPLAQAIFAIPGVKHLFFFDNYITVTRDEDHDWAALTDAVEALLQQQLPQHNPHYVESTVPLPDEPVVERTPEVDQIDAILDRTVRPYLAADGGGIVVLRREGKYVFIKYQGACGSCPSSIGGTLQAIQSILRDEIDPEIEVIETGSGEGAAAHY